MRKKKNALYDKVDMEKRRGRKERKVKVEGLHKGRVLFLWGLFVAGFIFAIYKNFTAIDKVEVVREKRVEEKLLTTAGLESFVRDFLFLYFSWEGEAEKVKELEKYVDKGLLEYIALAFSGNISEKANVENVEIWNVRRKEEDEFLVIASVLQNVVKEGSECRFENVYEIVVHRDKKGGMTVTRLPVMASLPDFGKYEKKAVKDSIEVDESLYKEVEGFLEDFFRIYPQAGREDLKYYEKNDVFSVIKGSKLLFKGLNKFVIKKAEKKKVEVLVYVEYMQEATGMLQVFEYDLKLEKGANWQIVGVN